MVSKSGNMILLLGAVTQLSLLAPVAGPANAQGWGDHRGGWHDNRGGSVRHDWERRRRKDAKTDGVVAGVVGTAVVVGVIAAIANSKDKKARERADYCRDRYGNYDPGSDGYRASDGRTYQCQ